MNHKHMSGLIILALLFAGCGGKKADVGEGEKKLVDTQKQLEEAKRQPGAEQKVAELEKQLAEAKKQLAESKDAPNRLLRPRQSNRLHPLSRSSTLSKPERQFRYAQQPRCQRRRRRPARHFRAR